MRIRQLRFLISFIVMFFCVGAHAQSIQPTDPMVFLWAEDTEAANQDRRALGSGFLVGTDGVILTARHVVDAREVGERIVVSISNKSALPVRIDDSDVVCADSSQDVCVIRIPEGAIPPSVNTKFKLLCQFPLPGSRLRAMGFFGGGDPFSGVNQPAGEVVGSLTRGRLLPTDIALVPTMSGGPVFDRNGYVIGLVKGALVDSDNLTLVTSIIGATTLLSNQGIECLKEVSNEDTLVNLRPFRRQVANSICGALNREFDYGTTVLMSVEDHDNGRNSCAEVCSDSVPICVGLVLVSRSVGTTAGQNCAYQPAKQYAADEAVFCCCR